MLPPSTSFYIWPKHKSSATYHPHLRGHCKGKGATLGLSPLNFHIFAGFSFFYSNNTGDRCIKDDLGVNEAIISHALLPCSVTLAKTAPSSWCATCHFLGNTEATRGDTFINGDDSRGISTSVRANRAGLSASLMNTAHVVHASRWQKKKKIAIMQRDYSCKYCNYKTFCKINQTVAMRKCRNTPQKKIANYFSQLRFIPKPSRTTATSDLQHKLLKIQSSYWLTDWLAPLLNKAPIVWNL